jgi:hypothetical protein
MKAWGGLSCCSAEGHHEHRTTHPIYRSPLKVSPSELNRQVHRLSASWRCRCILMKLGRPCAYR